MRPRAEAGVPAIRLGPLALGVEIVSPPAGTGGPCLKGRSTLAPALLSKYVTRPASCDCVAVSQALYGLGPIRWSAVSHVEARANPQHPLLYVPSP